MNINNALRQVKVKIVMWHVLAWLLYLSYYYIAEIAWLQGKASFPFFRIIYRALPAIFPFYFSAYIVYPACFSGKRNFLQILLIFLFFILANWGYQYLIACLSFPYSYGSGNSQFFITRLTILFNYSLLGLGFWYAKNLLKSERKLRDYETRQLQLENQKLQLQYDFLHAQINPHFLFNTIGFFHSRAMKFSKETAKGMELLSDIMRYSLNPVNPDRKVPLVDEVKQVNDFIELHQIRFENTLNVKFKQSGDLHNVRIPSHILLTLVENAFKHGIFNAGNPPLSIELNVQNGNIYFTVSNKISHTMNKLRASGSGIGLSYVRARLNKEYGDKSTLVQKSENGIFTVELNIAA